MLFKSTGTICLVRMELSVPSEPNHLLEKSHPLSAAEAKLEYTSAAWAENDANYRVNGAATLSLILIQRTYLMVAIPAVTVLIIIIKIVLV